MNQKSKNITGISAATIIIGMLHILHVFHFFSITDDSYNKVVPFQGKATIVFKDSITGKMDTMDIETYLKNQEKK